MSIFQSYKYLFVPLAFLLNTCLLLLMIANGPVIVQDSVSQNSAKVPDFKFPTCLEDIKKMMTILSSYKEKHLTYVYGLFCSAYVYKQTFAIPGSALLNILAGAVFGCFPYGLALCSLLTAIGATNCYFLSKIAGKELINKQFPSQVSWLREKLSENDGRLFLFLISLRLFPATPNWLLNIIAPIVNVPIGLFFCSVLIGLLPYNFICLTAGETLSEIESMDDIFTPKRLLCLLCLALTVFILSYFSRKQKVKLKKN